MKGNIKDYFDFRKSERSGTILLVLLILVALFIPELLKRFNSEEHDELNFYKIEVKELKSDSSSLKETRALVTETTVKIRNKVSKYNPVTFDPNTLDIAGWMRMGFSQKQAEVIVKYKYKIGGFSSKEDFKKIYIIDEHTYGLFEPFIELKSMPVEASYHTKPAINPRKPLYLVELNSADSIELLKVPGIGPVFAHRIIEFRQKLNGFSNVWQLTDVYGMDSSQVAEMQNQVFIDTSLITQLNVNTASLNDLRAHPYIGYYVAKAIIDYRIQYGKINSLDQLKKIKTINPEIYNRILPYLSLK